MKVQNKHHVLPTPFANTAIIAAYTDNRAERWLDQLREELEQQMNDVIDSIESNLPMLHTTRPEASYLLWIDFSELPMSAEERKSWLHQDVRIFLSPGSPFGPQGEAFERMNIGTRRELLDEAIHRLSAQMERKAFV